MDHSSDPFDSDDHDLLSHRLERDYHREPGPRRTRPALTARGTLRTLVAQLDAAKGRVS